MALTTFRDTIRRIMPWWLRGAIGGRVLYALAIAADALGDMLNAAVRARFPSAADESALAAHGRERRIQRGRLESSSTYAARLLLWLDAHRARGGPYALLAQLAAFWAVPALFAMTLIYASGRRFAMATDASVVRDDQAGWAPDSLTVSDWARWWLIMFWPTSILPDGLWSSAGTWDDGGIWDVSVASLDAVSAADVRLVPREWNAAHCKGQIVLLAPGSELWDYPEGLWSDPGVWGTAGSGTLKLDPDV